MRVAAEIFAEKGYHGAGVSEIGEAAGIQRGALYYHIKSKEDLLFQLCIRHIVEATERGRRAVGDAEGPVAKLRALVLAHLLTLSERHAEVIVQIREMHWLTGERAQEVKELRDKHEKLFIEVMKQGVDEGIFRSAGRLEVLGVLSMLNHTYLWLDPSGPLPIEEVSDRLTELIVSGIQNPDSAAKTARGKWMIP